MTAVSFKEFELDKTVVAQTIFRNNYGAQPHHTTSRGVILEQEVGKELRRFFREFNQATKDSRIFWPPFDYKNKVCHTPYYRVDAYFNESGLWVLEINASFVDGWGTALNLARASGIPIDAGKLNFPTRFASYSQAYWSELRLFVEELKILGREAQIVSKIEAEDTYVYGRVGTQFEQHVLPFNGIKLDDKTLLALFGWHIWKDSDLVRIPRHYCGIPKPDRSVSWEDIPEGVALKFCKKGSPESIRARASVILGKPTGEARFLKRCYREAKLIAQDFVEPAKDAEGRNCQLVILVVGDEPVTGYVQYSHHQIINDNSVHGPLWIK